MSEWDKPLVHTTRCMCEHDRDHNVVFAFYKDEQYGDEFILSSGLNHYKGFFGRLALGIKYILGIDNTYCSYTESTLNKEEVLRLRDYINDVADRFEDEPKPN